VIRLLAEGKANKETAAEWELPCATIETHRAKIMLKLGLLPSPSSFTIDPKIRSSQPPAPRITAQRCAAFNPRLPLQSHLFRQNIKSTFIFEGQRFRGEQSHLF